MVGGLRLTNEPTGEVFIAGQPCISPHRLSRICSGDSSVRSRAMTPALIVVLAGSRVYREVIVLPLVLTLNLWLCHGCFTVFMSFLRNYLM